MTENYINACVRSPFKKSDLEKYELTPLLNDDLFAELERAYEEDLSQTEHLISHKVKYYKSISYTIVNKDEHINVKLNVGDIVDVLEDISLLDNTSQNTAEIITRVSYARIKAILLHKKEQYQVPFIFLDWFISQEKIDNKLHCPLYRLQQPLDYTWRRIYAVKWVDHQPNVHFIHHCNTNCIDGKHSQNNMYYMHNIFYYLAV
jgi:hypothetical protein